MNTRRMIAAFVLAAAIPTAAFSAGDPDSEETPAFSAYDQGRAEAKEGNWSQAATLFRQAAAEDLEDFKALNMLGYSLRQGGDLPGAMKAYDRALAINPDYAEALEYRGVTRLKMGNRRGALADYQKLVRLGSPLAADLKEAIDSGAKN